MDEEEIAIRSFVIFPGCRYPDCPNLQLQIQIMFLAMTKWQKKINRFPDELEEEYG